MVMLHRHRERRPRDNGRSGLFALAVMAFLVAQPAAGELAGQNALGMDDLLRTAEMEQRRGHYRRAVRMLSTALRQAEAENDAYRVATISGSLGVAYLAIGLREEARIALEQSRQAAQNGGFAAVEAITLNNLGNLHAGTAAGSGDFPAALAAYDGAVRLALETDQPALAARASINAARLLGEVPAARERVQAALEHLNQTPDGPERALELVSVGLLIRDMGTLSLEGPRAGDRGRADAMLRAHALFKEAASIAADAGDARTESYALGYLASLYAEEGRSEEALGLTRRALFLAQMVEAPEALYHWQAQAGELLAAQGNRDAAITAYQGAVQTLQAIRTDLPAYDPETGQSLFRETVGPVYLALVQLLLNRAADQGSRPAQPDLVLARSTVEQLKTAELEDYFGDDCVALLQSRIAPVDRLADRSAALYPIILPDRLELLLSLPEGLSHVSVPVTQNALEDEVRQFRQALDERAFNNQFRRDAMPHARQLHAWLIAPIEEQLAEHDVDTLIFVPDGALRTIPLAALNDGERFLVERYASAVVPGLSLFDPRPFARTEIYPLLVGLTEFVQGFTPLPQVEQELQTIEDMYGGTVLQDEAFVSARLRDELQETPYTIVHIASHAQFGSKPEDTFLLTHDGRLGMDALERLIRPSRLRDQPIELIMLSACETAAGDDRAALGLAGVAVKAGARSASATLWPVADDAAARLTAEFYRGLGNPDLTKAEALRRAQLALLKDEDYSHPFFWAPFLLIGNWL